MKRILITIVLAVASLFTFGNSPVKPEGKTFVLVHGAWQAPYAWEYVKARLEAKGQKVLVVELPAHGNDTTSPANVTMDKYRDKVISVINSQQGKVILVGHSMGGMIISAVAEKIPAKIEKLVYIGAFVPQSGQSLLQLTKSDKQAVLGVALSQPTPVTLHVNRDSLINIFVQDGSAAIQEQVLANYKDEPLIPFTNPVTVTPANFGKVKKYYVYTTLDHAVGIDIQKQMVGTGGIKNTYSLNSSHCPFLSMPDEMTAILLKVIQ